MQEYRGHATIGDISEVDSIEETSEWCYRSPGEGREVEEQDKKATGQAGTGEGGTGPETEGTVPTGIPTSWGTNKWEEGSTIYNSSK